MFRNNPNIQDHQDRLQDDLGLVQGWESGVVLGIPLLENAKVTQLPFHVFDRYEIHIQDLKMFYEVLHHFPVHVSKLQRFETSKKQTFKKNKVSKVPNFNVFASKNKLKNGKFLNLKM